MWKHNITLPHFLIRTRDGTIGKFHIAILVAQNITIYNSITILAIEMKEEINKSEITFLLNDYLFCQKSSQFSQQESSTTGL